MEQALQAIMGLLMALSLSACSNEATTPSILENTTIPEKPAISAPASSHADASVASDAIASSSNSDSLDNAESYADVLVGGWEINQGSLDLDDNADAKTAFEKATEGLDGYDYKVIAYLGSQVVAGTNYSYLCKGAVVVPDAESEYLIVTVYEDLEGNAQITGEQRLLGDSSEDLDGSWEYNQGSPALDDNPDVETAFEQATDGVTDAHYEPIAYIGSQVVAGTNYAILCSITSDNGQQRDGYCLVTIWEDLQGNAQLTDVQDVELGADAKKVEM